MIVLVRLFGIVLCEALIVSVLPDVIYRCAHLAVGINLFEKYSRFLIAFLSEQIPPVSGMNFDKNSEIHLKLKLCDLHKTVSFKLVIISCSVI